MGLVFLIGLSGCQTLREVSALREVDFAISRVTETTLAGVPIERIQDQQELSASELIQLSQAVQAGELPLDATIHVRAENPGDNSVQARLVELDWTLFLNEKETIQGVFDEPTVLPPGEPKDIAIPVRVELVRFFGQNLRDLVDLALAVSGAEGYSADLKLEAEPTVQTRLGRIRYPNPVTIVRTSVGRDASSSP